MFVLSASKMGRNPYDKGKITVPDDEHGNPPTIKAQKIDMKIEGEDRCEVCQHPESEVGPLSQGHGYDSICDDCCEEKRGGF